MNGFPEDEPWWSDDEPLIRSNSMRPAIIWAWCFAAGAFVVGAFAAFAGITAWLAGWL